MEDSNQPFDIANGTQNYYLSPKKSNLFSTVNTHEYKSTIKNDNWTNKLLQSQNSSGIITPLRSSAETIKNPPTKNIERMSEQSENWTSSGMITPLRSSIKTLITKNIERRSEESNNWSTNVLITPLSSSSKTIKTTKNIKTKLEQSDKPHLQYPYSIARESACLIIKFKSIGAEALKTKCEKYYYKWIEFADLKYILAHTSYCLLWESRYRKEASNLYEALFGKSPFRNTKHTCELCIGGAKAKKIILRPISEIKQELPEDSEKPCICPFTDCGRMFMSMADLNIHVNRNHVEGKR